MTEIIYFVLVILLLARIFGEIAVRLGQTVMIGELVSGIALGTLVSNLPGWFPYLSQLGHDEVFHAFREFGVFFLMLLAGMELAPNELIKASPRGAKIAGGALLCASLMGLGMGYLVIPDNDLKWIQIFCLCVIICITAVPILVKTLMDLDIIDREYSRVAISAAFFVEIAALVGLAILIELIHTQAFPDITGLVTIMAKVLMFFGVIFIFARYIFPHFSRILRRVVADEFEFSAIIILALLCALISSLLSMHFLIGAFMAGLLFQPGTLTETKYKSVTAKIEGLTLGFFAPIFFAGIGFALDISALWNVPWFILSLVLVMMISKILGASFIARRNGIFKRHSYMIGVGLAAKGSLDLIVIELANDMGLFDNADHPILQYMFSSVVMSSVIVTVSIPFLMHYFKTRWDKTPEQIEAVKEREAAAKGK